MFGTNIASTDTAITSDEHYWQTFINNNDDEAFSILYKRYFTSLYRYGYHLTPHKEAVLDAVQNLFVYIYQHRASLNEVYSVRSYLLTSLRRTVARTMVQERKYIADEDLTIGTMASQEDFSIGEAAHFIMDIHPSLEELWADDDESKARRTRVLHSINNLPKRQREVIYLYFYEQLSHKQIAEMMEIKIETVYIVLHRALKSLHTLLLPQT